MSINDKENHTNMEPLSGNAETSNKTVHRDEQKNCNMQFVPSFLSQLHGIFPEETSKSKPEEHILLLSGSALVQDGKFMDALKTSENSKLNDDISFQKPASSDAGNFQTAAASMQEANVYLPGAMTSHELDSLELISSRETDMFSCENVASSPKVIDLVSDSSEDMKESSDCVLDLICVDDCDTGVSCDPSTMTSENQECLYWKPSGSGYEQSQPTERIIPRRKGKSKQYTGTSDYSIVPVAAKVNSKWLKPFELGWRREIVVRKEFDANGARPADVYYYSPSGRKLRSLREIFQHLKGKECLVDGTCFNFSRNIIYKEPFETVRSAGESGGRSAHSSPTKPHASSMRNSPAVSENLKKGKLETDTTTLKKASDKLEQFKGLLAKRRSSSEIVKAVNATEIQKIKRIRMTDECYFKDSGQKLCGWNCPGSEGVPPSLPCDVCMCMFHPACVQVKESSINSFTCQACSCRAGSNSTLSCPSVRTIIPLLQPVTSAKPCIASKPSSELCHVQGLPDLQHGVDVAGQHFLAPPPLVLAASQSAPFIIPLSFIRPICIPIVNPLPVISSALPNITSTSSLVHATPVAGTCQGTNFPVKSRMQNPAMLQLPKSMKFVLPSNIGCQLDIRKPLAINFNGRQMLFQPNEITRVPDGIKVLISDKHISCSIPSLSCPQPAVTAHCVASDSSLCRNGNKNDSLVTGSEVDVKKSQELLTSQQSQSLLSIVSAYSLAMLPAVATAVSSAFHQQLQYISQMQKLTSMAHLKSTEAETSQGTFQNASVLEKTASLDCNLNVVTPVCTAEPVIITVDGDSDTDADCSSSASTLKTQLSHKISQPARTVLSGLSTMSPLYLSSKASSNGSLNPHEVTKVVSSAESCLTAVTSAIRGQLSSRLMQEPDVSLLASRRSSSSADSVAPLNETGDHSCGKTTSENTQNSAIEKASKSHLSRRSAKGLMWSEFGLFHAGFNSMLTIFQYLGVCDILRIAAVCKTWHSVSLLPDLWRCVRLHGCHVKNWQNAAAHFRHMNTRLLDMRGMIQPQDDCRTAWQHIGGRLALLSSLQVIDFGQCPAKVVLVVTEKLLNLRSVTAEIILDPSNDVISAGATFDLPKLSHLHHLELLKLRGISGISFPVSSNPCELLKLCTLTKLKNLSLTTLKNIEGQHLSFIGSMHLLTTLELGDCFNWTKETFEILANLVNLTSLRLENGGKSSDIGFGNALKKMTKLEQLELIRYFVADDLAMVFPSLSHLKTFFIWPEIHEKEAKVGRQNSVILSTLSRMSFLRHLFWGITLDDRSVCELPSAAGGTSVNQPKIPFLLKGMSGGLGDHHPALSMRLLTINDVISSLCEHLPDAKIQVFQVPTKDQNHQQNN